MRCMQVLFAPKFLPSQLPLAFNDLRTVLYLNMRLKFPSAKVFF